MKTIASQNLLSPLHSPIPPIQPSSGLSLLFFLFRGMGVGVGGGWSPDAVQMQQ